MFIFGGASNTSVYGDFWEYFISNNTWTQLNPSSAVPNARYDQSVIYSNYANSMAMFGGSNAAGTIYFNDLWEYSIPGNTWIQINTSGTTPSIRTGASTVYEPSSHQMIIYGGFSIYSYQSFQDVWSFTIQMMTTSQLTTQMQVTTQIQTTNQFTTQLLFTTNRPQVTTNEVTQTYANDSNNSGTIIGAVLGVLLGIVLLV